MTNVLLLLLGSAAAVPDSCQSSQLLPAYAHNDYRNPRPLADALALGYRGVEADVFRVRTELIVGHERSRLQRSPTLARVYLEPLRERLRACGFVLGDSTPFFLNIELKEADSTAFRYLLSQLSQFGELFTPEPWVVVTLVGWWPSGGSGAWPDYLRAQRVVSRSGVSAAGGVPIGLVSVDYGKVLNWSGRGTVSRTTQQRLDTARDSARAAGVRLRVHHIPLNEAVYRWLLAQEGMLIGTTDLEGTRALLQRILH